MFYPTRFYCQWVIKANWCRFSFKLSAAENLSLTNRGTCWSKNHHKRKQLTVQTIICRQNFPIYEAEKQHLARTNEYWLLLLLFEIYCWDKKDDWPKNVTIVKCWGNLLKIKTSVFFFEKNTTFNKSHYSKVNFVVIVAYLSRMHPSVA